MKKQLFKTSKITQAILLIFHALKIGVFGGLAGVLYIAIISVVFNVIFLGRLNINFNFSTQSPASFWGIGIILVPILGGLVVVWLIKNFGANEIGVSEPDVIHFLHHHEGKNRYITELTKSLASIITIGTGGSVGQEIPIVQLGATVSYMFGMISRIPAQERIVLLAAGAAASLAAVFNAPFAGLAFAIEILLFSFSISHAILIAISSFTGAFIGQLFFGSKILFEFKSIPVENLLTLVKNLLLFIPFGILIGVMSAGLIFGIDFFEKIFTKHFKNLYLRHTIGMTLVGVMLFLMITYTGHYFVDGLGHATIQDILNLVISNIWLLLLIFVCKFFSLCFTLGSGASGGIFTPSLFLGATLGAACGAIINYYFPQLHISQIYFVVAGMAGMLASVTGALITAIIFTLEITKDYHIALPILVTIISGTLMRILVYPKGIYTFKLYQHGIMFNRKL